MLQSSLRKELLYTKPAIMPCNTMFPLARLFYIPAEWLPARVEPLRLPRPEKAGRRPRLQTFTKPPTSGQQPMVPAGGFSHHILQMRPDWDPLLCHRPAYSAPNLTMHLDRGLAFFPDSFRFAPGSPNLYVCLHSSSRSFPAKKFHLGGV